MISKLCREHTHLTPGDIIKIKEVANSLQAIADLTGADIFIDCLTRDPDVSIVVAQAKPSNKPSLYKGFVVGEFARRENEPAALRTLGIGMPTTDMMARTQENRDVMQNVSPIKNDGGQVIGVLIAETDVTEDIRTRRTLSMLSRTTEQLAETLISTRHKDDGIPYHITDGIIMFDPQGVATYANPVAKDIYKKLGYINNIEGLEFANMALDNTCFSSILDKKQINVNEVRLGNLILNVKYALMKNKDRDVAGAVMLLRDETDAKAKEKELILKSVAIKEIHHRVKNNLQTIASLLRLQSRRIDDQAAKSAFKESISRVLSIAATHEILAQNGVDDVDLKTMLGRIKNGLLGHGHAANKNITVTIQGDTFETDSDTATSIALVVNEVIQNSLKYAFPDRDKGRIVIELHKGTMYSNISITDDGVGFDVNEEKRSSSLGSRIIRQIVTDKLKGNFSMESTDRGTKVLFDFLLEREGQ
ncbi:MAG: histidine kinase [Desulfobacteraceae bacterium]|nr:histidine kinase [Desulfobacteraceae bacterium]